MISQQGKRGRNRRLPATPVEERKRGRRTASAADASKVMNQIVRIAQEYPKLTEQEIGKMTDRTQQYVADVLLMHGVEKERVKAFRENESAILAEKCNKMLHQIRGEKIEKATLRDLSFSYGILKDKRDGIEGKGHEALRGIANLVIQVDKIVMGQRDDSVTIDVTPDPKALESLNNNDSEHLQHQQDAPLGPGGDGGGMPSGPTTSDYATPVQDESQQKAPVSLPRKVSKGQRGWRTRKLKEKEEK